MSRQDLEGWARRGELAPDDRVRKEGTDLWLPARRVAGLFASPADERRAAEPETPATPTGSASSKQDVSSGRSMESILPEPGGLLNWTSVAVMTAVVGVAVLAVWWWAIPALTGPSFPEPRLHGDAPEAADGQATARAVWEIALLVVDGLLVVAVMVYLMRRRAAGR